MSTSTQPRPSATPAAASADIGAWLVALAGVGLVIYGIMFLIRNFAGFIELGLTPEAVGSTPAQIQAFSPDLYHYISHLHVAMSGSIIGLGVAVIALALFGIRRKEPWALWTAFLAPVIAVGIGVPLHFSYGLASLGHLGPIYLDAAVLLAGTLISLRAVRPS
jgi:hypothetical protein